MYTILDTRLGFKMKIPKIFFKIFGAIFILTFIYIIFVFYFFIPKIENNTIALEDTLGKIELEKTLQLVQNYARELEDYKSIAIKKRKEELKELTQIIYNIININYKKSLHRSANTEFLKEETLNLISQIRYDNNNYFFIANYDNILISHPYLKNKNFSKIKDIHGNLIVPNLINIAKIKNDGFLRYWWRKNNTDLTPYEKITYAKKFSPWHWVIGTGTYIDDIKKDVQKRKVKLIQKLQKSLTKTNIHKNYYVYVFDASGNVIIHPNENFKSKKTYIFNDLIKAYKNGKKKLYHNWNTSTDKGNYKYRKISWIEYEPNFNWYICSSEYIDEAHAASDNLKKFMIYSILVMIFIIITIGLYFLKQIFNPILTLADNAQEVIEGNLDARYSDSISNDEIGLLAMQYNTMLNTIQTQMDTLDTKVQEKTKKLTVALKEKEILLKEINHRVKNNLYVINSIIGLQAFQNSDIKIEDFIKTMQQRIHSMAIGHEMLTKNANINRLDTTKYIPDLVQSLIEAYIVDPSSCECVYEISPITLSLDRLLSCGLIINELVTNAIKYAFKSSNSHLLISLKEEGVSLELVIQDNGSGFDHTQRSGVGIELVEMLVQQMNGIITFQRQKGMRVTINFPK